ncbi:MAG: hypothetical protein HYX40_11690 [Sphingobacteriales bacterium]|nr:hypothetical protein [Sphingobacteriales bacterium]
MKRILFTAIGSLMLYSVSNASGNTTQKSPSLIVIKPAAMQCNFAFLRGHRKGNGTSLTWGMDGAGAVKFLVSRSYDFDPYDPYAVWEDAGTVNADNSRSYKLDDNNVFPGTIHYKIVAVLSDGSSVCSQITSVRINKK